MLLATVLYRYAKEAQQIQQIGDFAILLSAFLRLRVLLSTDVGLRRRTRKIRLQLLWLQLSAPRLPAGPRSPCWRLRRDARRPPC